MLIGREKEKAILLDAFRSDESEFVAVYGRRRVGKTYLIREPSTICLPSNILAFSAHHCVKN